MRLHSSIAIAASLLLATSSLSHAQPKELASGVFEVDVTGDTTRRWGEPQIAVNPKNPQNMVYTIVGLAYTKACLEAAGYDPENPCGSRKLPNGSSRSIGLGDNVPGFSVVGLWVTFDGGRTWKRTANIPGEISTFPTDHKAHQARSLSGDPFVAAAADGSFYVGWDAIHFTATAQAVIDYGGIGLSRSTDGGLTWGPTRLSGTGADRPMITSDLSANTVYTMSSGAFGPNGTGDLSAVPPPGSAGGGRYLVSTKDGLTWTRPQPTNGSGTGMSAAQGILGHGFVATGQAATRLCGGAPAPCVIFQTTQDSGANWSRNVMPIKVSGPGGRPLVAAHPTKRGHFTVVMLMGDKEFHVYRTQDAGKSWSAPTVFTDDAKRSHYQPSLAYGPNGDLVIMWKLRDAPPRAPDAPSLPVGAGPPPAAAPAAYDVFAVRSQDEGATFSRPLKLNSVQSPAPSRQGDGADDLTYVAVTGDTAYFAFATWASTERAGHLTAAKLSAFKK